MKNLRAGSRRSPLLRGLALHRKGGKYTRSYDRGHLHTVQRCLKTRVMYVSPGRDVQIGDEAVLFGKQGERSIAAEELSARAGTSVYKILIWQSSLLPRTYLQS